MTFEELGIQSEILRAITEMGYETPTPVQEAVIPLLLTGSSDIVALAQTGTGKTAAFGLPTLQRVDISKRVPQALILAPTRELCLQIAGDLQDYAKYTNGLKILPVYGGSSIDSQIRSLTNGVHIIVATPGRLLDLMTRRKANLETINTVVLDEADEMLNMGFTESIDSILSSVPEGRSMLLFSATMPKEIARISKKYMKSPKEVTIGNKNESTNNVKHVAYIVHARDKYSALKRLADSNPSIYGIIFCRTRRETQEIADWLIKDGYSADSLHGELSQAQRDAVMQKFRFRSIQLLVATDVAARGLDVNDLTHVINYGLPDDVESYTHRSGRTGRAGKTGTAVAIVHIKEKGKMREIERIINKKFEIGLVPTGRQICEKQLYHFMDQVEKVKVNEEEIAAYQVAAEKKLDWLTKEDLIKRIISMEMNRLIDYYQGANEIETVDEKRSRLESDGDKRGRSISEGFKRVFVNVGKMDGLFPNTLIEMLNKELGFRVNIGKIDLLKNFSYFEVDQNETQGVINRLNEGISFQGRKLFAEEAQQQPQSESRRRGPSSSGGGSGFRKGREDSSRGRSFGGGAKPRRDDRNDRPSSDDGDKGWRKKTRR